MLNASDSSFLLLRPPASLKGSWNKTYFNNESPIVLELGCGKGDYTLALAELFPDKNFIGIDRESRPIWLGAKTAFEKGLSNTAFINEHIENLLSHFAGGETDEIWLPFPDLYPEAYNMGKRLTSPNFLELYRKILKPGGAVHLKTNDEDFLDYTKLAAGKLGLDLQDEARDIYAGGPNDALLAIRTAAEAESIERGDKIHYLKFTI